MDDFDAIVVGGGPGGSTAAAFVAMDGHRVLLLERERFPRYQIGESLLPATVHGICNMLGVRDALAQAGFTRKRGGTFRWGRNEEPWTFAFEGPPELNEDVGYAYQVERSRFDQILLDNARRLGVDVREEHTVTELLVEGGQELQGFRGSEVHGARVAGVRFTDASGREHEARARYVVDASGHQTRLAAYVGERVYSEFFRNVALFCYFENGRRLPPPNEGNILSAAFGHGWFWYIPLSPTLTSVGAVVGREHAARLRDGHEEAMRSFIEECPIIREFLSGATRVTQGPYGQFRVRKDYSYCHTRFWMPGAVLVGDAACFVDPVFSSGVHLATYSALLAARATNTSLRVAARRAEPAGAPYEAPDERRCFIEFERRYRHEFGSFYQFLMSFYDMNQDPDWYFWSARKVLNTPESANDAFVRLVAGLGSSGEPLYGSAREYFRARAGLGEVIQRTTEAMQRVAMEPPPSIDELSEGISLDEKLFHPRQLQQNLRHGSGDVLSLGVHGFPRRSDTPLFEGGLVPSRDGLRWVEREAVGDTR